MCCIFLRAGHGKLIANPWLRWPESVLSHPWITLQDILVWSPFLLHIHPLDIHSYYPYMTAHMSVELLSLTGQGYL